LPPEKQTTNIGSIEDNPEYKLLTQSNTLSTSIDSEIILVHKFIRDHYSVRFPELETLIQNPLDYAKAVAIIGNGPMENIREISESKDNMLGQTLRQVLDGPSVMVVTVEATNTRGEPLSENELATVKRACEMVLRLDKAKKLLTDYVRSRMNLFAPNLTTLIGSLTAAQLLNYAGGVTGLAKTPACNLAPLGSKKNTTALGLASNTGVRHQGFLYSNEIIRAVPSDLKKQAMRILSAKVVLAARIDQAHEAPNGEQGLAFYDQVEKRINKLSEAAPNSGVRALPAPDEKPARKRGGRRARKAKEANAVTDLRKAQNRMVFGKEEAEVGYASARCKSTTRLVPNSARRTPAGEVLRLPAVVQRHLCAASVEVPAMRTRSGTPDCGQLVSVRERKHRSAAVPRVPPVRLHSLPYRVWNLLIQRSEKR
jgi:U4/U6 small nuclear ribonucleoprotein PRP31